MRSKQINLSVPIGDVAIIEAFTAQCKHDRKSRSEVIIGLIRDHGKCGSVMKWQDAVAEAAYGDPLPDFLL